LATSVKQVGAAEGAVANSNHTRSANRSDICFLLLNRALKPLYMSAQAAEVLFHPQKASKAKDFVDQLASKIRTLVANGGPSGGAFVCREFLSGRRRYVCRFFGVQLPNKNSKGSALALLLERSPEATVDMLKICKQYHLTPREGEAVRVLAQGLSSKEIASRMQISPNTLKVFLRLAMMKMGVSSRRAIMSKFIHAKT
jgi:DNA-binding CsgD family transcriptional regulator